MAIMPGADRVAVRADMAERLSLLREPLGLTKPELKAAVDATDLWISNNAASYNNSLPAAAKANLTKAQKARLLTLVAEKRFNVDV